MAKTFRTPIVPVVITYSFDSEIPIWLYSSDKEAEDALWENFQKELQIEKEENGRTEGLDMTVITSDDHRYACIKILNHNGTEDITEWSIGTVMND